MEQKHIQLQFERLKRHHVACKDNIDEISMLDLAHSLRIVDEMSKDIDALIVGKGLEIAFPNTVKRNSVKAILNRTKFVSAPLSTSPETSSGMRLKGLFIAHGSFSHEEIKKMYEAGPPQIKNENLSFDEWLGSEVLETKSGEGARIGISRRMIIKRVANILGASHPMGKDEENEYEHKFDPFIKELHSISVANGYPLTYYQLMEIAEVIIEKIGRVF